MLFTLSEMCITLIAVKGIKQMLGKKINKVK